MPQEPPAPAGAVLAHADPAGWQQVGPAGAWQPTLAGGVLHGRLYTAESSGGLFATDLDTGAWRQLGAAEFGTTKFTFARGDCLYTIEEDGSLSRVFAR